MLDLYLTNAFKKDVKKSKKQHLDLTVLERIVNDLRQNKPLPTKHHNHKLIGNYTNCYECHLKHDWLLIYEQINHQLILHRIGSHSELF